MKSLNYLNEHRVMLGGSMGDEYCGAFKFRLKEIGIWFTVIASDGLDWDHVSVSTETRCPRWDEMQKIKEMFFEDYEVVMQLHPAKDNYISLHPYTLHMWKPHNIKIPLPPTIMV
jgi:hypothetical protein